MKVRLVSDDDGKSWAVIVEGGGEELSRREYKTREAALKARERLLTEMRGTSDG